MSLRRLYTRYSYFDLIIMTLLQSYDTQITALESREEEQLILFCIINKLIDKYS